MFEKPNSDLQFAMENKEMQKVILMVEETTPETCNYFFVQWIGFVHFRFVTRIVCLTEMLVELKVSTRQTVSGNT